MYSSLKDAGNGNHCYWLTKVMSPYHHHFQVQWRFILVIVLILHSSSSYHVNSQDVDYFYHQRAYQQNVLPDLIAPSSSASSRRAWIPSDYTVDHGYAKTLFRLRSDPRGKPETLLATDSGEPGNRNNNDGYDVVEDSYSSVKAVGDSRENPIGSNRQLSPDSLKTPGSKAYLNKDTIHESTVVKHVPTPLAHLKASNLHVDHSQPITMYARASSSARINSKADESVNNLVFVGSVIGVTVIGIFVVIATGYFVHRINLQKKAAADVEYPAYGVVGPGATLKEKESQSSVKSGSGSVKASGSGIIGSGSLSPVVGDRRLVQSAQMYHYHHQKQQMISSDKMAETGQNQSTSDADSEEEENEEGDYTVYECPGLASTGEMEVKNPLFHDDITPVSSPSVSNVKPDGSK